MSSLEDVLCRTLAALSKDYDWRFVTNLKSVPRFIPTGFVERYHLDIYLTHKVDWSRRHVVSVA